MTHNRAIRWISAACIVAAGALVSRAQETAADTASPPAPTMNQISAASQDVYKKIAGSLVRVRMDQPVMLLGQPLQKEFVEWRRQQPEFRNPNARAAATQPALARQNRPFLQRWLEKKIAEETNEEQKKKLQSVLALVNAPVAETMGVVIDNQGNVLVFGANIHDQSAGDGYLLFTMDGEELRAKYVGAQQNRGFALLKLDSAGALPPIELAADRPAPGETLLQMSARNGSINVIMAPGRFGRKLPDDRFAIPGGEGPVLIFNAKGQLAALGLERFALPLDAVAKDIKWILDNGKDIAPRKLGVAYDPITPELRTRLQLGKDQPAVRVKEVAKGSPAERAGIRKDDVLLRIGQYPLSPLGFNQIQADLTTRTGTVPIEVIRNEQHVTLAMPLDTSDLPTSPPSDKR